MTFGKLEYRTLKNRSARNPANESWGFSILLGAVCLLLGAGSVSGQADAMHIVNGGDVGVGTDSPLAALHVQRDASAPVKMLRLENSGSPTIVLSNTTLGNIFEFRITDGGSFAFDNLSLPGGEEFRVRSDGGVEVSIHDFHVKLGNILVPVGDIIVQGDTLDHPDYVFDDDYDLMSLDDLGDFIEENGHLPGLLSADEAREAGGVGLKGLQMTLLEKVEELTLYTLQQEERLTALEAENVALREELLRSGL